MGVDVYSGPRQCFHCHPKNNTPLIASPLISTRFESKICSHFLYFKTPRLSGGFKVQKIQCGNETLYFPYTYIDFSAVFALVFLIFLLDLMIFSIKKVQTICLNSFIYRIFWTFQNFFKKFLIFYKKAYIFKGYFTPRTLIA